jgi:iron complex outermembrane receptor protein
MDNPRSIIDANTALPTQAIGPQVSNSLGDPFLSKGPTLKHMGMRRDTVRLALQGGYKLPRELNLDFNAGFNNSDTVAAWDLDRTSVQNFFNIQPILTDDLTLDLRLSSDAKQRVRGLVGVSYFRSTYRVSQVDFNKVFQTAATYAYTLNTGNFSNSHSEVPAIYGSVDWDILDTLTLSGDIRYQKDKIISLKRADGAPVTNETKKSLPRITLSYKPNKDTNFYVSYAEGVQPLSLNSSFVNSTPAQKAYLQSILPGISEYSDVPTLKSFEIGAKQTLLGGRLQYTVALYDSKWDNRITFANVFNPASCNGPPVVQLTAACPLPLSGSNQALGNNAKVRGLELSVNGSLTEKWTAGLNLTVNDDKWDRYFNSNFASWIGPVAPATAPPRRFDGNELAKVPKVTASFSTTFRAPLVGDWDGFARGDVRYQGRMWDSDLNITQSDAYTRVNARFGMEKKDVSLELYVNNVFNDKHWDSIYRLPNLALVPLTSFANQGLGVLLPSKRELGIQASMKFD